MLTATNEAMSEDFFTKSAIQGGFFARTFVIYEKERQSINSLIYPLTNPPNYAISSEYLKEVAKLNGPFAPLSSLEKSDCFKYRKIKGDREIYFNTAGIIYDDWYDNFCEMMKHQEVKDETGTLNRFGDSVLKIAMLLALAAKPELVLTEECMTNAISESEKLLGNIRKTTLGKHGISNSSMLKTMIIMELLNRDNHQVTRIVLMKKLWMHYENPNEFDEMMLSFDNAGMIKTNSIGNQIIYTMPNNQVIELKRFMAGKSQK